MHAHDAPTRTFWARGLRASPTAFALPLAVTIAVALVAGLGGLSLQTANRWDEAPVCGPGSTGRCVTEVPGRVVTGGVLTCTVGPYGSCSDLPVDLDFADGTSRTLNISQHDRISAVLSGGQRNAHVVPASSAPVIGRFYGSHLVGLVFPSTGSRLATDDYPGYAVNAAAQVGMFLVPVIFCLLSVVVVWRRERGARVRSSSPPRVGGQTQKSSPAWTSPG